MESKTRLFGHPVHSMLAIIPAGLSICAIILDTIFLFMKNPALPIVSFLDISAAILGGLFVALLGFHHWLAIPDDTHEKRIGAMHGVNNMIVILLFTISWWLRSKNIDAVPSTLALFFSYAAIVVGILTAWLGSQATLYAELERDHDTSLDVFNSIFDEQAYISRNTL